MFFGKIFCHLLLNPRLKKIFFSPDSEKGLSSKPSFFSLFFKLEKFVELTEFTSYFSFIGELSFFKVFIKLTIFLKISSLLFSKSSYLTNNVLNSFVFFQDL